MYASEYLKKPFWQKNVFVEISDKNLWVGPVTANQKYNCLIQGFQYFSSVPVLHYLQAVLLIKI